MIKYSIAVRIVCGSFLRAMNPPGKASLAVWSASLSLASVAAGAEVPDFNREVRPILSNYCFKCHGPDEGSRKGELRLDLREEAMKPAESGETALVPGHPEASELVKRILSDDKDDVMPPPSMKKELSAAQKDVLKRWVAGGAKYDPHWAFVPPHKAELPEAAAETGVGHPVDAWITTRLAEAGLGLSPEADRATLIRRVSLDLIGLPPTPEEVAAFENDAAPGAYERLVHRLLAAPQYGERWARKWMDLARYADSNGYEKDRTRTIWPWRDWVVQALNADLPFDQFTIEQLAGDLLPGATVEQRIATGFHRNTMLNEEGGIDPLEFRYHAVADRVATTGATWLGLTLGCAQCHTHKYDPITHKEYFSIFAFLNNADEPELDLPSPDAATQQAQRAAKVRQLLGDLPGKWPVPAESSTSTPPNELDGVNPEQRRAEAVEQAFTTWLEKERVRRVSWTALKPAELKSSLPILTVQPDASILTSGDTQKTDVFDLKFTGGLERITAIRLEALPDASLPAHGPGYCYYEGPKGDFFLGEFQVLADGRPVKFSRASHSYAKNNFGKNPASAEAAVDGDPQTGWTCADRMGEAHEAVFLPSEPITAQALDLKMIFGRHYACALGRFRISVTTQAGGAEARESSEEIDGLLAVPEAALTAEQRAQLREQFFLQAPELAAAVKEIRQLRKPVAGLTTLVLRERPEDHPRPTFLHHRGEFLQPKDEVKPGVLAVLNPLPVDAPKDRLAFARWVVSRENPLTARVVVNRAWAAFFGRGIVRTTDDFGFQGETPSHPALLDWLAVDFMEHGWSMKRLHRTIVTSAAYRQSSRVTPESLAKDPENRLLSRSPRVRLEAEMVRDGALRAAGLLSLKMGGPPVRPPQPDGVSEVAYGQPKWDTSQGEDRYRRSLYTFSKRTAPFALYSTFDAPTGEACIPRREVSNTALQALTVLNDVTFLEAARAMGRVLANAPGSEEDRLQMAYRRILTRAARPEEVAALKEFLKNQRDRFAAGDLDAVAFAGPGANPDIAGYSAVFRAILNLDEVVTKP